MQPIHMTREEYERKYGVKPVISTSKLDNTPAPVHMTRAEYEATYGVPPPFATQNKPGVFSRVLSDTASDVEETAKGFVGALREGGQNFAHNLKGSVGFGDPKVSKTSYASALVPSALSPVANAAGEAALGTVKLFTTDEFEKAFAGDVGAVVSAAYEAGIPLVGKSAKDIYENLSPQNKFTLTKLIAPAANVIASEPAGVVGAKVTNGAIKGGSKVISKVGEITDTLSQIRKAKSVTKNDKAIAEVADEILNVESGYNKLRRVNEYSKDAEASRQRIAQSNVLAAYVDRNGVIDGLSASKAYRELPITNDGLKLKDVEDLVRRTLEDEGKTINLADIKRELTSEIYDSGLEGADLVAALQGIEKQLSGLSQRKINATGDIPLYKLHDAKLNEYDNIDFNTPAETKTYRKAVARTYKRLVEEVSGKNIEEINQELSTFYEDIKRLKNLDGKRVEGGRLGKYSAALVGSVVGSFAGSVAGAPGSAVGGLLGSELGAGVKGISMSNKFNKGVQPVTQNNEVLRKAVLRVPDKPVEAPKGLKKTPQIEKVENQIAKNVADQKKAIKAGDFTLVAALKEVYKVLVDKLKAEVRKLKQFNEDAGQGGFINLFGAEKPNYIKPRNRAQASPTNIPNKTVISSKVAKEGLRVKELRRTLVDKQKIANNPRQPTARRKAAEKAALAIEKEIKRLSK